MSEQGPRYATIGDYLRVFRRHRLLIALVLIAFVAAALAASLSRPTVYSATAKLAYRDPLQDLALVGDSGQIYSDISPAQRSTIAADQITSPKITAKVRKKLGVKASAGALAGAISTSVDVQTNLVLVQADWGNAHFAAKLANAFADQARNLGIGDTERRLKEARDVIQDSLKRAKNQQPPQGIKISILQANLQRIKGLLSIADPADIVQTAQAPSLPSSPRVKRDTVLGAILGLVVALIAAFVRDSLDRRLRSPREIHDETGLPVLGRIGAPAFKHAGLVNNERAPLSENEFEAFRVLRMNLAHLRESNPLRSVLVTSPLPEEGKTTTSISLASAAALAGQRVLLVECDLRRPSFSQRLGIPREPGLTDYLRDAASPGEILQQVKIEAPVMSKSKNGDQKQAGPAASMVVIAAGVPVSNAPELLQSPRFDDFLRKVSKAYDMIILDGSPLLSVADPLELIADVDGVLVCVRAQQTTRDQVRAARTTLGLLPERPSGVVVTGLKRGDETYEYYYGY